MMSSTAFPPRAAIECGSLLVYDNPLTRTSLLFGSVHAFLYVGSKIIKGFLDVDIVFGRNLKKGYAKLVCELLALFGRNSPLPFPVAFIADEDFMHTFASMLLDVRKPCSDVCRERSIN